MARKQALTLAVGLIWVHFVLHASLVTGTVSKNPRNYLRSIRSNKDIDESVFSYGVTEEVFLTDPNTENQDTLGSSSNFRPQFQKLVIDSENVILPKFGDRISPRNKQHSSSSANPVNLDNEGSSGNINNNNLNSAKSYDNLNTANRVVISTKNINNGGDNLISNSVSASANNSDLSPRRTIASKERVLIPKLNTSLTQNDHSNEISLKTNEVDSPILLSETQVNNQNVSSAQAHRLEMSTEFFVIPSASTPLPLITKTTTRRPQNGGLLILATKENRKSHQSLSSNKGVTPPTIVPSTHPTGLRKEPWVVPVLVLATLSMLMMVAFEVFVLCKAWRTSPSRRHLFLGQMLLLGLFSCAGLAAILTATPTLLSCATVRFGAGVAFALVFASLLVKCVFLISLNGGVYLPAPYQGLLLLFAVLIQIAVGSQWLLTSPPAVDNISTPLPSSHPIIINQRNASILLQGANNHLGGNKTSPNLSSFITPTIPLCRTQFSELLLSLIYVVFLILFVAILAIKSRGIRDNYREATYIGLAIGGSIPIWLGWTLCGLAVAERHRDACLAFGLIATSTTVFLVMFMPKGRQLAAMGKEGLYVEDREERFSSLSRAGSGYSPSFFHFKPIKYGVMGGHSPSNTNTGLGLSNNLNNTISHNNNSSSGNNIVNSGSTTKHHQAVATLGGDRVALVAAPSYTRMYHYYPAHLTHPLCYYPNPYLLPPPHPHHPFLNPPTLKPSSFYNKSQHHRLQHYQQQQQPTPHKTARYPGLFMRPDDANLYTTLEPATLSSNPNVYFQRSGNVHPGMMY